MAEYLPSSIKDKVKVHKIAKKGTRLISSHLDWTRLVNEGFINDCEYMKIIYMNCRQRHKYESNLHSNEHYLSISENKAWKKNQPCMGFEPINPWPTELSSQLGAGHYVGPK